MRRRRATRARWAGGTRMTLLAWTRTCFSSRGRHTRYWRDWSSDVCSSDLRAATATTRWISASGARSPASSSGSPATRDPVRAPTRRWTTAWKTPSSHHNCRGRFPGMRPTAFTCGDGCRCPSAGSPTSCNSPRETPRPRTWWSTARAFPSRWWMKAVFRSGRRAPCASRTTSTSTCISSASSRFYITCGPGVSDSTTLPTTAIRIPSTTFWARRNSVRTAGGRSAPSACVCACWGESKRGGGHLRLRCDQCDPVRLGARLGLLHPGHQPQGLHGRDHPREPALVGAAEHGHPGGRQENLEYPNRIGAVLEMQRQLLVFLEGLLHGADLSEDGRADVIRLRRRNGLFGGGILRGGQQRLLRELFGEFAQSHPGLMLTFSLAPPKPHRRRRGVASIRVLEWQIGRAH